MGLGSGYQQQYYGHSNGNDGMWMETEMDSAQSEQQSYAVHHLYRGSRNPFPGMAMGMTMAVPPPSNSSFVYPSKFSGGGRDTHHGHPMMHHHQSSQFDDAIAHHHPHHPYGHGYAPASAPPKFQFSNSDRFKRNYAEEVADHDDYAYTHERYGGGGGGGGYAFNSYYNNINCKPPHYGFREKRI